MAETAVSAAPPASARVICTMRSTIRRTALCPLVLMIATLRPAPPLSTQSGVPSPSAVHTAVYMTSCVLPQELSPSSSETMPR